MPNLIRISALLAAAGLAGPALGQTMTMVGANTPADPYWNRPLANGSGLSGRITPLRAVPFYLSQAGSFELRSSQDWDAVFFLYSGAFNPSDPLAGYLAGNDDDFTGPWIATPGGPWLSFSRIPPSALAANTQYWLVTSSFAEGNYGEFVNEIIGPGVVTMAAIGEATGSCTRPDNTCVQSSAAFCATQGGTYLGDGSACPQPGACCLPSATCALLLGPACVAQNGTFRGDGAPCAGANCPFGACCLASGSCVTSTSAGCAAQNGVYRGDGTFCATANCPQPPTQFAEQGESGDLPGTANVTVGTGPVVSILGSLGANDADMYRIRIVSPSQFSASTIGGAAFDTQLFLFSASGHGVIANDDASGGQSLIGAISGQAGDYYIAVTRYNRDPLSPGGAIFASGTGTVLPNGPGGSQPISGWSGSTSAAGNYRITLAGSEYAQSPAGPCYANCDASTGAPVLNVADFTCFLQRFAAGEVYANCDGSTSPPVLNVADFTCFLQKFAAGCSAP